MDIVVLMIHSDIQMVTAVFLDTCDLSFSPGPFFLMLFSLKFVATIGPLAFVVIVIVDMLFNLSVFPYYVVTVSLMNKGYEKKNVTLHY